MEQVSAVKVSWGSDKEVSAGNRGIRRVCVIGFQLRVFAPLPYLLSPGSQFTKLT